MLSVIALLQLTTTLKTGDEALQLFCTAGLSNRVYH